ncbi:MAG: hypothetical protein OHK0011_00280 [Turneriella sp.]
MRISTRMWIVVTLALTLAALAIKFYFLPSAERFIRLSVEEQIHREMQDFEKIIAVVVTAANGDKEYVRRALYAISANKSVPIELRRSNFLTHQFGYRKDREVRNEFERRVMETAQAAFRETEQYLEYAYPLRAQPICQTCHVKDGKPISLGQPVGIAIRRLPLSALSESRIRYFTLDLFWENFGLLLFCIATIMLPVWLWVLRPLSRLSEQSRYLLEQQETAREEPVALSEGEKYPDEWQAIQRLVADARDKQS